ncbi:hypothetical protein Bhyg_07005 [Pseudolycoriella hygida]|uniref:Uncharacterized protein n=1 Tax=Pseudolycoriella hygida TaxID=35572 RepID=A0A9Q0S2F3_9DIPT|nr:hypothetical protein Bhyg_07005 [Pseudolycoriella hygida]
MKYFIFLFLLAIISEITIQSVVEAGQQLNNFECFEGRPLSKVIAFNGGSTDGVIVLVALRRRSSKKYKKLVQSTTEKAVKVTTEEVIKVRTEEDVPITTEEVIEVTTKKTEILTTQKMVRVTTEKPVKVVPSTTSDPPKVTQEYKILSRLRKNQIRNEDTKDPLWIARKRVTRPPKIFSSRKPVVVDEEDYSSRRARYLFSQRLGK